jgi:hypothetical protein
LHHRPALSAGALHSRQAGRRLGSALQHHMRGNPLLLGNWYAHQDKGDVFQVVAIDAHDGTIEVQEFDGAVDEVDLDT